MSYITPSSAIMLMTVEYLNPLYTHVLHFKNEQQKVKWRANHKAAGFKDVITGISYLRDGVSIKLPYNADKVRHVNYLAYCNDPLDENPFSERWFYCFVTEVRYINSECCEMFIQEDVITTWGVKANLTSQYAMVERWTAPTDEPGDNKEGEDLQLPEYVTVQRTKLYNDPSDYDPEYIALTLDPFNKELMQFETGRDVDSTEDTVTTISGYETIDGEDVPIAKESQTIVATNTEEPEKSAVVSTSFNYMTLSCLNVTNLESNPDEEGASYSPVLMAEKMIEAAINDYAGEPEGEIIGFYMRPKVANDTVLTGEKAKGSYNLGVEVKYTRPDPSTRSLDGYVPRNKKLCTYPFVNQAVTNDQGSCQTFIPHMWYGSGSGVKGSLECKFRLYAAPLNAGTLMLMPTNYTSYGASTDKSISIKAMVELPWKSDSYAAYIAQKRAKSWFNAFSQSHPVLGGMVGFAAPVLGIDQSSLDYTDNAAGLATTASGLLTTTKLAPSTAKTLKKTGTLLGLAEDASEVMGAAKFAAKGLGGPVALALGAVQLAGAAYNASVQSNMNYNYLLPDQLHGSVDIDSCFDFALKEGNLHPVYGFWMNELSIPAWAAKSFDQYFDRYGYSLRRRVWWNLNARKYWTYIKATDLVLQNAQIPLKAQLEILEILGRGVTFWNMNADGSAPACTVGDYTQTNSIVG